VAGQCSTVAGSGLFHLMGGSGLGLTLLNVRAALATVNSPSRFRKNLPVTFLPKMKEQMEAIASG
jgi:hypothetical protein